MTSLQTNDKFQSILFSLLNAARFAVSQQLIEGLWPQVAETAREDEQGIVCWGKCHDPMTVRSTRVL